MTDAAPRPTARRAVDDSRLTPRRNVPLAQHHREQGRSIAQIAHLLHRTPATVRGYLHDPTGEEAKQRKRAYAGTCQHCGTPTSGANGKNRAPRHCQRCKPQSQPRWTRELVHGAHRFGASASASSPPRSTGPGPTRAGAAERRLSATGPRAGRRSR